jgi:hypothetical protein
MMDVDLEKVQREEIRWRVLAVLNAGRPKPVTESLVLRVLTDVSLPATPASLRKELDYLEARKLITIKDESAPVWMCELTHLGVDLVEYTVPCHPGIARPERA